jgi:hypothetical protein
MNRRRFLTGAVTAAAVAAAGAAGFVLWAREGIGAWREAVETTRRPIAPGLSGREALQELVRFATLAANKRLSGQTKLLTASDVRRSSSEGKRHIDRYGFMKGSQLA